MARVMGRNVEERYFAWPRHLLPVVGHDGLGLTDAQVADLMGCTRRQVVRLRRIGLDYWWADHLATRVLRMHPQQVWPNWRYRTTLALLFEDAS